MTPIAEIALKVMPEQTPEPDLGLLKADWQIAKEELIGIQDLYEAKLAELEEAQRLARANWETQNAELIALHSEAGAKVTETEKALRAAVVEIYKLRGDQNRQVAPHLGLSVQVRKTYSIADRQKMLRWAMQRPEFLVANEKAILETAENEKVAKIMGIDFVSVTEKPSAKIKGE